MKKLPIYDVILSDDDLGMTAVSFVDEPAIEELFVAFNKQHLMMSNEKQEVISPILIPDQEIYRYDKNTGKEFYIRWSEETIDAVAVQYLLNQRQNNTTIMHPQFYDASLQLEDCLVDDVYLKRMWIIDNPKEDIANTKFGYSLPQGTLMVHYKIFNNHLWQRIKKGELKGLSIEAFMSMVKHK